MSRMRIIDKTYVVSLITIVFSLLAINASAGQWGNDQWGRMYWGAGPSGDGSSSQPTQSPVYSIVAESDTIYIDVQGYTPGEGDGFAPVYEYVATCGEITSAPFTTTVTLSGFNPGETYSCSVTARNTNGLYEPGPDEFQVVTTEDYVPSGLNIIMICAAIGCNAT